MKYNQIILFILFIGISCQSKKKMVAEEISSATFELLMRYEIPNLTVNYDIAIMEANPEDGMYKYIDALDLAIDSYLTDARNEESPLYLVSQLMDNYKGNIPKEKQEKTKLLELINNGGSLCMPDLEGSSEICFYAEEGESVEKNWIFLLQIPEFSGHMFWAIVPKDGKQPVYNYGFN